MFTDSGTPCYYIDTDKTEVPEAPQLCAAFNRDIEGRSQLDSIAHARRGGRVIGGVNRICDIFRPLNLGAEKFKHLICFRIDTAGKLYLLYHLVRTVIQLLFRGNDRKQVNDKCQQQHRDKNEYHGAEIACLRQLAAQYYADSFH